MTIPENLRYSEEHEWVCLEGDTATIGITDHAQEQLGDIVFVELPERGAILSCMGIFGTVEAVKTVSDLFSPMGGAIQEINTNLESAPESVNHDPYGAGWMIKVTVSDRAEYENLMTADGYRQFIGE